MVVGVTWVQLRLSLDCQVGLGIDEAMELETSAPESPGVTEETPDGTEEELRGMSLHEGGERVGIAGAPYYKDNEVEDLSF